MSERYPDLNEPAQTTIGHFPVVGIVGSGEYVECCLCFAVVRKNRAKGHAASHVQVMSRLDHLRKAFHLRSVAEQPSIDWLEESWDKPSSAYDPSRPPVKPKAKSPYAPPRT